MKEFLLLLPEIFLAITFVGIIAGEIGYHGERLRLVTATALVGLGSALIQAFLTYRLGINQLFGRALTIDGLSYFFKMFFILLAILAVISSTQTREISRRRHAEYCALIIASTLAMCLASSAADILLIFLSFQFMNVLAYFLAAFGKKSILSTEAGAKYMIFGTVSGALLLYGGAILFSYTHSLNIYDMHQALMTAQMPRNTVMVIFMMIFLSLTAQVAAFPMHLWMPDVIEGAPTPASAFLSLGPRAAGFAVAIRLLISVFAQPDSVEGQWKILEGLDWTRIVAEIAGITMLVGSLMAFRQTAAKRMVSYLVIAEGGFLLMGLLVLDEGGVVALLYNLMIDLFAVMGTTFVLSFLYDELGSDKLKDLSGMLGRAVPECLSLILFLACLVGLPPFPGFLGKFTLVGAAVRHQRYSLALMAIASMAFGTVAVARLAYSLVGDFKHPVKTRLKGLAPSAARRIFLLGLFVPVAMLGAFANLILGWAGQSLRFIFW